MKIKKNTLTTGNEKIITYKLESNWISFKFSIIKSI